MSRKLSYSRSAFIARMRISKEVAVFLVVEGREFDVPFYERLARSTIRVREAGFQVWLIEQITRDQDLSGVAPGGKDAVIGLYDYCRRRRKLSVSNSGGRRSIAFCVDRDNDDVASSLRRSAHVIYTSMFDAEAHAFVFGDGLEALCSAASLDTVSAGDFIAAHPDWIHDLALLWRNWIELCCLAKAHSSWCHVGFRRKSAINGSGYDPVIDSEAQKAHEVIARKSRIPIQRRGQVDNTIVRRIERCYRSGDAVRLVSGRWMADYLCHLLEAYYSGAPVALGKFKERALVAFAGTLDYSSDWADYYRKRLEVLV